MALNIDWDKLTFSFRPTKSMYMTTGTEYGNWKDGELLPVGPISLSPAACILHYGQGLIEGLKALRTRDDRIVLFRLWDYAKRMERGCLRMCMPPFPPERFIDAVISTVKANIEFVPPYKKGSLYIRPCLWGTGAVLGLTPASEYTFLVVTSPVGSYFKGGITPIKIKITTEFHRSAPKGTGHVKTVSNYAGSMLASKQAKSEGFAECIFLDSRHDKYIEEIGGANFFCMYEGKLLTPKKGSILPGQTRDSVMKIAEKILNIEVLETDISIEKALNADEVFCTGTAAVISPIGLISYGGEEAVFNNFKVGPVSMKLYEHLIQIQLKEEEDPFDWVMEI